jgi:hypothetical protein
MKLVPPGAALLLLVLFPGCDRVLAPPAPAVYAAWEEGLTLGYEAPGSHQRLSVRVKEARPSASGLAVTETFSSTGGFWEARLLQKDGGVLLDPDGGRIPLLPEGFPDRVARWSTGRSYSWVVGRATADLPGVVFGDPSAKVGVWVETFRLDGAGRRSRTLYLPDIGEAETREWDQPTGRWVTTNRLVTRGFTDVPSNGSHS